MSTTFQIAEVAQHQQAAATLSAQPVDGPCDDTKAGLGVLLAVAAVLWQRRRRYAQQREPTPTGPVPLDAPQLRSRQ